MSAENEALHAVLQEQVTLGLPEGSVLTAWVLVAELIGPDGERRLVKVTGPDGASPMLHEGLLHNGLYAGWEHDEDVDGA